MLHEQVIHSSEGVGEGGSQSNQSHAVYVIERVSVSRHLTLGEVCALPVLMHIATAYLSLNLLRYCASI